MNFTSDERQHEDWWLTGSTNIIRRGARKTVPLELVQEEYENTALAASHLVELDAKILNAIQEAATCKVMGLSVGRLRDRVVYLHLRAMRLEKGCRMEHISSRAKQGRRMLEGIWAWVLRGDIDELVAKSTSSLAPDDSANPRQACPVVQKVIRPEFPRPEGQKMKPKRSGSHESVIREPLKKTEEPEKKKEKSNQCVDLMLSPIGSIWSLAEGRSPPTTPGEPMREKVAASHTPITPPLPAPKDGSLGKKETIPSINPKVARLDGTKDRVKMPERGRVRERTPPPQDNRHHEKREYKREKRKWQRHQDYEARKRNRQGGGAAPNLNQKGKNEA